MTPNEFAQKWAATSLGEKQSYQAHFMDLCRLVSHETPAGDGKTAAGQAFQFEPTVQTGQGRHGFADVWLQDHFAIEYKAPGKYKDLDGAYRQLLEYREALHNPPLLVVTDINNWEIHTNFPNTQKRVYAFSHGEIVSNPAVMGWLQDLFHAPQRLHPRFNSEQVTREAAQAFQLIADNMRDWDAEPQRIAFFLTKLVFCLFAEDIGLLPTAADSLDGIFTHIIEQSRRKPSVFQQYVRNLFVAMNNGGEVLMQDIPYFNGTLFQVVTVEALSAEALDGLAKAAALDWSDIEPSIFGTLFERSLDPNKRSQLGAHYTSRDDILLIVEPVLMQPLRYHWETIQLRAAPIRERHDKARTGRAKTNARRQLLELRAEMLERIRTITVLDPACGSGNFLYVSLQLLMDLEKEVIHHPLWQGFQLAAPAVHPRQMYGIEINPIAHALASIVVWIGYIQWRKNNGYARAFAEPILEELADNIVCRDAILPRPPQSPHPPAPSPKMREGEQAQPAQSDESPRPLDGGGGLGVGVNWPAVDVIVGNPPFLGNKRMWTELGDEYYHRLIRHYEGRIPGGVDLVCYWFEVARQHIESGKAKRAGLLATNSIRGGLNREVLKRIKQSGDIFMAWSDRSWILDGAAVRVSMVGFDDGTQTMMSLDGLPVATINPDLTADVDITGAKVLAENQLLSFQGIIKRGPFDINAELAAKMLAADSRNSDVVKRIFNAMDITRRPRNVWIIDFGVNTSREVAEQYELPFAHVEKYVKPVRAKVKQEKSRRLWWLHESSRPNMRNHLKGLDRFIATPRVAKHRLFVWLDIEVLPDSATVAIARDDDYFFGVLHSKLHEVWSLRMGTSLEDRPRYTPTTTFETFPFPWSPGREDETDPAHAAISAAARQLHAERQAWQYPHPPAPSPKMREGEQTRVKWDIPPELERRMQAIARELRNNPTVAEDKLWQAIRKRRLDGRKFRRQVAIGAFVVDFYCSSERLAVEVDGPIHENQREADRIRQEIIESLGIRFVRLSNEEVEHQLESSLNKIRQALADSLRADQIDKSDASPSLSLGEGYRVGARSTLPLDGGGVWAGGESAFKDRTLTNLYNALQVWRGESDIRVKPAAADFAPRLDELHRALDIAVCAAYGWELAVLDDEEELLRRLLALNLERAG